MLLFIHGTPLKISIVKDFILISDSLKNFGIMPYLPHFGTLEYVYITLKRKQK